MIKKHVKNYFYKLIQNNLLLRLFYKLISYTMSKDKNTLKNKIYPSQIDSIILSFRINKQFAEQMDIKTKLFEFIKHKQNDFFKSKK